VFLDLKQWPKRLAEESEDSLHELEHEKERMTIRLEKQREAFDKEMNELEKRIHAFQEHGDPTKLVEVVDEANGIESDLQAAVEKAGDFNRRERLFDLPITNFSHVEETQEHWAPFFELWTNLAELENSSVMWKTSPFLELPVQEIDDSVQHWLSSSKKFTRNYEDAYPGPSAVAQNLNEKARDFQQYVPII